MTRTLNTLAAAASTVMAMIITFGLISASAQAAGYLKIGDLKTEAAASDSSHSAQVKAADGAVCCSIPRTGKLALIKPSDCRAVKGKIVNKTKCARVKRVSARKFANIVLKRGTMSSSKPATHGSLSPGAAKGVTCSNGNYYPCWCSGEEICNLFISACVEDGGEIGCTGHNDQTGEPNACACVK